MVHSRLKSAAFLLTLGLTLTAFPQTKAEDRITQAIDDRETAVLEGNLHGQLKNALDQGRMDGGARLEGVSLVFKRTAAQDAAIETLLREQQDPSSANYHKWLTPEQYADRFGLSIADVAAVTLWLQGQGFTVERVARNRTRVFFTGTVSRIETVFRTEIHHYLVRGEQHFANATELSVPAALSEVVLGFNHLDDFRPKARVKSHTVSAQEIKSHYLLNGVHNLAPADFAKIYDIPSTPTGSNQSIVVVGQSNIILSDLDQFRTIFSLPARTTSNFQQTLVPNTGTGVVLSANDSAESSLDLEWAAGVATGAKVLFFQAGSTGSAFDAITYAIEQKSAPIITTSYGLCELQFTATQTNSLVQLGQMANAQGQTVIAAAGDTGAADCDAPGLPAQGGLAVDLPGAMPYTTSVGGTTFNEGSGTYWSSGGAALSYIPETTWNETTLVQQLEATGGGKSSLFSKPDWQTGTGVPSDGVRDVPDIALAASPQHDGYLFCATDPTTNTGGCPARLSIAGGTSFGAPTFAGILAILNQKTGVTTGQGNINPTLYAVAASHPESFHDITTGNNIVPCGSGTPDCPTSGALQYGYSAGPGYDLVTGWGTIDANLLVTNWSSGNPTAADFTMFGDTVSISAPGGQGTSTITVDGRNGFSGSVSFTCSAPASALVTCSISGSPVALSATTTSGSATLTVQTKATAALDPRNAPLWLTGSGALFAGVLVLGIPAQRRRWAALFTLVILALLAAAVGCGGSSGSNAKSPGTPVGTYNVTVTGTVSGSSTTHTTTVAVHVL
jgi:subtilase family serine protease